MWSKPNFISLRSGSVAVYDTGEVHSDVQASKPVLFFVHGLGLNALLWKYAIQHLQANYRCIAVDLPGHGLSWQQRGNFTMTFYAQQLRECVEAMGLSDITLVGHSMGGQISVILALQLPAVVQRLVLVAAAGIETFTPEEAQQIVQGAEFLYRAPVDVQQVLSLYAPHFTMHAERVRELAEDHIQQQTERFTEFRETVIASISGMLKEPVNNFLPHIHQPVLVLYGEKDQLIPNRWVHPGMTIQAIAQTAKQRLHHPEVKVIPAAGHYLPFELPHDFATEVHHFCLR